MSDLSFAPDSATAPLSRRDRKKLETRRKIFEAAMELMQEVGFDGVTITEICDKADVANATFFLHYPNKTELLSGFIEEMAHDLEIRTAAFEGSPIERLNFLRGVMAEHWSINLNLMQHVLTHMTAQRLSATPAISAQATINALTTQTIVAAQESGQINQEFDAAFISQALFSIWSVVCPQAALSGGVEAAERAGKNALKLVLDGCKA